MQSIRSLFRHSPLLNALFAGLACAIALLITTAPAFAQSPIAPARVEVHGHTGAMPLRHDISKVCTGIADQLEDALQSTWMNEQQNGELAVQMVMQAGEIVGVQARGMSSKVVYAVRRAVGNLQCSGASEDNAVYRFRLAFVMPDSADTQARKARRLALLAPAKAS
ncbi:MAG: hypothetical protein DI603_20890 [Roseateles depolymerans]|uniref:Uncharacterized protein n=1 Tax=Roseateles depolymerans TaxID=76731 RepID=A0A2W5DDF1_9BURK|nr:MAG: hypothetical protein DI603_20890 [Roseateles depolymerans]